MNDRRVATRAYLPQYLLFIGLLCGDSAFAADGDEGHAHEHTHKKHEEIETIVVTGSPLEHDRDEIAIPVDRVDRDQLLLNLGSTLGESISNIPGITTTGFSAGASRPVIRGQAGFRTAVLEDGIGTHDVSRESPDHAVPINPLAARRIEVVRGPATLRYGGSATAGVINTITDRVPDRIPDDQIRGEVFAGLGLVANRRDVAAILDGGTGRFAWHADGALRKANNYSIPNDGNPHTQAGSRADSFSGSFGGAWIDDPGRLGFSYTHVESDYGIPEKDQSVNIKMHTDRYRFEADLDKPISGIREIRMRGVYSNYEHREIANGVTGQTFRNKEFEGRLELIHEQVAGFLGTIGLHARKRDLRAEGEAAKFLSPTNKNSLALYIVEERDLSDSLSAEIGFRVEHLRVEGTDVKALKHDLDFVPMSGSLGLVSNPTDWLTIGAHASVSQRAPSQSQLFSRGPHEATRTFERGNVKLDPETVYTGELRVEAKGEKGRLEVAAFVSQYNGFIYAARTGNFVNQTGVAVAGGGLTELAYRSRDAVFYGAEASGELDLFDLGIGTLGVSGRFDFVRARFLRGANRNLPRIVPIRWGGGVYLEGESLTARVGFLRTEAQNKTAQFETPTANFTYLNASLAYHLSLMDDMIPLDLTITARNLTDARGRNHISFNKNEVLAPGRSIRFGARVRF